MRRQERGIKFLSELALKRKQAGSCPRCGRDNNTGKYLCDICREKLKEYKAVKRMKKEKNLLLNPALLTEKFLEFEKKIQLLELFKERAIRYAESRYMQGYRAGKKNEKHITEEARDEWEQMYGQRSDMIDCRFDIEDAKRFSHTWSKAI